MSKWSDPFIHSLLRHVNTVYARNRRSSAEEILAEEHADTLSDEASDVLSESNDNDCWQ